MKYIKTLGWIFAMALAVAACSLHRAIVGKWQQVGGKETMEFSDTDSITVVANGMSAIGKYGIADDVHLTIAFEGAAALGGPRYMDAKVSGDVLTLTSASGQATTYHRVKE